MLEGLAIGARHSRLLIAAGGDLLSAAELGGGMTAEFLCGAAGIVLGVLALLGIDAPILTVVATTAIGGALLVGSGALTRLNYLEITAQGTHERAQEVAREVVSAAAAAQVLIGLWAAILGILALVGFSAMTLTLVGVLCIGGATMLSGTAVSSRLLRLVHG